MQSVGQGELATLDSHKQMDHWGPTQLVQRAFKFDCFTRSFKISYKSLMQLYVSYLRGKEMFLCFLGGGHLCGEADLRLERHFRFFVTHYLPSAGNYEMKLKWSTNLIFTEKKLVVSFWGHWMLLEQHHWVYKCYRSQLLPLEVWSMDQNI